MARSTATIKTLIMTKIAADPILGPLLTSTSLTSIYGLFSAIFAYIHNLLEQSWDDYKAQLLTYSRQTPAASTNWIAAQAFLYQYDPGGSSLTNALTILPNGALGYATVDPRFNIVTRCAALTDGNNTVRIKVAQGATPSIISGPAFTQLQDYFDAKGTAGVNYNVSSGNADLIAIKGSVYYKSGFAGVVKANVENALNAYLNTIAIYSPGSQEPINYEGLIKVSDIIDTIRGAEGVADFELDKLWGRPDGSTFLQATVIYDLLNSLNNRSYILAAGYGIEETDGGNTWGDLISYLSA